MAPVILAFVAIGILALLALFQVALIAGAPLGRFVWGGEEDVLDPRLRGWSAFSILLYALFAAILLQAANLVQLFDPTIGVVAVWLLCAWFFYSFARAGLSHSIPERAVMAPANIVLCGLTLVVAVTGHLAR